MSRGLSAINVETSRKKAQEAFEALADKSFAAVLAEEETNKNSGDESYATGFLIEAFLKNQSDANRVDFGNLISGIQTLGIENEDYKFNLIQRFLENQSDANRVDFGNLILGIQRLGIEKQVFKYSLIGFFLENQSDANRVDFGNFILGIQRLEITDPQGIFSPISIFLKNQSDANRVDFGNLISGIQRLGIENEGLKYSIIIDFLKNKPDANRVKFGDLILGIQTLGIENEDYKFTLIKDFLKNQSDTNRVEFGNLISGIQRLGIIDLGAQFTLIVDFLKNQPDVDRVKFGDLILGIQGLGITDPEAIFPLISTFLKNQPDVDRVKFGDLILGIQRLGITDHRNKFTLIKDFLENQSDANRVDFGNLISEIDKLNLLPLQKLFLIEFFLKFKKEDGQQIDFRQIVTGNFNVTTLSFDDLKDIFSEEEYSIGQSLLDFAYDTITVAVAFLTRNPIPNNQKQFERKAKKQSALIEYLLSDAFTGDEDFAKLYISGTLDKTDLIKTILTFQKHKKPEETHKLAIKLIGDFNLSLAPEDVYKIAKHISSNDPNNVVDNLLEVIAKLGHTDGYVKRDFIFELIKDFGEKLSINTLQKILGTIDNGEVALQIIKSTLQIGVLKKPADIIRVVQGRSAKLYQSLTTIFHVVYERSQEEEKEERERSQEEQKGEAPNIAATRRNLAPFLTDEGINNAIRIFDLGNNADTIINIEGLLSYFDIYGQIPLFTKLLRPDFLKEIQNNFSLPQDVLIIRTQEMKKIQQLVGDEGVESLQKGVTSMEVLSKHLTKVIRVPELKRDKVYNIDFSGADLFVGNTTIIDEVEKKEKVGEISAAFEGLIFGEPSENEILSFFENISAPEMFKGIEDVESKLLNFFKENKKEIAFFLCHTKLGVGEFRAILATMAHGCSKNPGLQLRLALFRKIIELGQDEPQNQKVKLTEEQKKEKEIEVSVNIVLYDIFDRICRQIINESSSDITTHVNPFENKNITSCFLSPEALFAEVVEFFKNKDQEATNLLRLCLGDDVTLKIAETGNEELKQATAYFVLSRTIGVEEALKSETGKAAAAAIESAKNSAKEDERLPQTPSPSTSTSSAAAKSSSSSQQQ